LICEKRWPVAVWGVNPSVKEVMIAVWKAFNREEEVNGFLIVKVCSSFLAKWNMCDVE